MARATWQGAVIAESDDVVIVEGNVYFPPDAVDRRYLRESAHRTVCSWKGTASYFDLVVGGATNPNAAWTYPEPTEAARAVTGRIAFWHGVRVDR